MTLEDLRILVAACEAGSMSSLARELQRTQSSISQHIARLEAELGIRLFERHARGVQPTAAGKILKDFALEGLDAIEVGLQRVRALQHGESDTLTITTGGTTVRHFMRHAVVRFRKEHPGVNLRFLPASSTRRCFEILRLNQAELGFVTTGEPARGINEKTIARQRMFLLTTKDDELSRRRKLRLQDLKSIRYLGLAGGTTHHSAIEQAAAQRGVELKAEVVFDDFDTAKLFVELGLGQAIVPAVHAYNFERSGSVKAVPITDLPSVSIGWAFRHWHHLSPAAREFVAITNLEIGKLHNVPGLELSAAIR
ncbi:LysR family transcriptional regulator [Peristeroidobacter agariperforans]|uniref:LysR family transcriptional regulator n=1 Tax=Peristeroidobacter agariperforans TaxID=268404 RepID=UPI00101CE4D4|nr:LysR family transcriptional regulator [Peristeroidobacter agariperforans]